MPQTDFIPCGDMRAANELAQALKDLSYTDARSVLMLRANDLLVSPADGRQLLAVLMVAGAEANTALLEYLKPRLALLVRDTQTFLNLLGFLEPLGTAVLLNTLGRAALYDLLKHSKQVLDAFAKVHPDARASLLHHLGEHLPLQFSGVNEIATLLAWQSPEEVCLLYVWFEASNPVFTKAHYRIFLSRLIECCDKAPGVFTLSRNRAVLTRFVSHKLSLLDLQHAHSLSELSTIFDAFGPIGLYTLYSSLQEMMKLIYTTDQEELRMCLLQLTKWQLCQQTFSVSDLILVLCEASEVFAQLYLETLGWNIIDNIISDHLTRMQFLRGVSLQTTRFIAQSVPWILTKAAESIEHISEIMLYLDTASAQRVLVRAIGPYLHRFYENSQEVVRALSCLDDARQLVLLEGILHRLPDVFKKYSDWLALLNTLENKSTVLVIKVFQNRIINTVQTENDKNALLSRFLVCEAAYTQLQARSYPKIRFFKPVVLLQEEKMPNTLQNSA